MDPVAVKAWRREERERLLATRIEAPAAQRRIWGSAIEARLHSTLKKRRGITLGVYWPFQAEFDPRPLVEELIHDGFAVALPVVVDKNGPLEYRSWKPGDPLIDGVWGMPVPEHREVIVPQAVLAPLVGFDRACYRLGYGGGYFDRTLAALAPKPLAIGVGFELSRIETIYPQEFDIPMDLIVSEAGIYRG
jgi:5-formyltetrahydrofolate cyclo-ligase